MNFGGDDSDEHLAARAKVGDRAAFDILVRRHKDAIYRFVRRYIGQADDAYDVLQNCFLAAWIGLSHYDHTRPFLPWLRMIALNKCRDFGRRQTVRRIVLKAFATLPLTEEAVDASGENDESIDAAVRLARLDKAIAELPEFYKDPLLLTVVSGLSHDEAADMLSTTPKAVEMRLYRARRKILAAMQAPKPEG